ncbi:MAG: Branched-chain amino acid transport ATP-binding protein LivF, partial [uncultured Ramlibacter sp.]
LRHVPEPEGTRVQSRHAAVGWRATDACGGAHPAHRGAPAAAGRDFRRAGAGHRAEAGRDHPHAQGQGLHHRAGRTELPLRGTTGRSLLHHGARQDRQGLRPGRAGRQHLRAAGLPRCL